MIDHETEHTFPLAKAGEHVDFPLSPATAWRWALKGLRSRTGPAAGPIRLETALIGGRRYTSREAIARFVVRLSEPGAEAAVATVSRADQIARAAERAETTF